MRIPSCIDDDEEEEDELDGEENGEAENEHAATKDGPSLSFTPEQAHIFGGQSIFLSFVNIDEPLSEDIFYYVVFKGSKLQHITSAKVLNPYTLQAVIPDHNEAELVILSVYQYTDDTDVLNPDKNIMATDTFVYTSDSSQFLTQQLALNVDNSSNLLNLQNVYSTLIDIPLHEKKSLDYKLTASFRNLSLPPNWSLVSKTKKEDEKSWTLLHFCAKYNFPMLAEYLMVKPGAKEALRTQDDRDRLPIDIANLTKHKKMLEVLTRNPCEEDLTVDAEQEVKRPTVKRHKLGTTTFTNNVSEGQDITVKDLMILRELDALVTSSKESQKNGSVEMADDQYPLAESLKKLHEINEEIRRLRTINSKDHFDRLDGAESIGSFGADMVSKESLDTCNGEHHEDENMNKHNSMNSINEVEANENEKISEDEEPSTTIQVEEEEEINNKELTCENENENKEENGDDDEEALDETLVEERLEEDDERPPKPERQHSNVSVNKIELHVAENIVEQVEVTPVVEDVVTTEELSEEQAEVVNCVTNSADEAADCRGVLTSVTEETEEELDDEGNAKSPNKKVQSSANNVNEKKLPPLPVPYRRVGVLRKSKKDRPLSDSFENLRMVENQGIIDFYRGATTTETNDGQGLTRGHSLDTLTKDLDDGNDTERSTTSVNDFHGSQESVSSDNESNCRMRSTSSFSRDRSDSGKSIGSHRTLSLLSLTEYRSHKHHSSDELTKLSKKSSSLFHRISFKKAKSMTSLETREKNISKNDDRRKTITEGEHGDFLRDDKYQDPSFSKDGDFTDSNQEMMYGDILVHCESYCDDQLMKSKSSPSLKRSSKGSSHGSHDHSEDDTDEGTSHEIGEQHVTERKTSADDKQKRLFGILRTKSYSSKERKGSKEKKEEKLKDRRDSDAKTKKKTLNSRGEVTAANKSDSKSFLPKRGSSFRKPVPEPKSSDKSRLMKGPTALGNSFKKQQSDRKSPLATARFNPQIPEVPEGGNDYNDPSLLPLNKNLSSSQASLNSYTEYYNEDDTDAAYSPLDENEYDSDLDLPDEPETWSELVDKKVQRKMHAKDIKRQDVIYELIQTESFYVRILQIMKKIYMDGMRRHLGFTADVLDAMFPKLEDLIELNGNFLRDMKKEQESSQNFCVNRIGNIILNHFDGENGKLFKEKYGYFCSHHLEAVALYKEFLKSDKRFQAHVKTWLTKPQARRLSVPECITYITIRMTKYPLLIEAIIKATKEVNPDHADLNKALGLIKEILVGVDEEVESFEQQKELLNLIKNLDTKHFVEIKTETKPGSEPVKSGRLRATKLIHKRCRLMYYSKVQLKVKNKVHDVRMVVLADKMVFLQENGGKLQLLNVENKMPFMSMRANIIIRNVATDPKNLFLINMSNQNNDIYEIIFDKAKEKDEFVPKFEKYMKNAPEEEVEDLSDNEEEDLKREEEKMKRIKDTIDKLEQTNHSIQSQLYAKNDLVKTLLEIFEDETIVKNGSPSVEKPVDNEQKPPIDLYNARVQLELCLLTDVSHSYSSPFGKHQTNSLLQSHNVTPQTTTPSPVSSPGQANNHSTTPTTTTQQTIPKKSDTFGGFDQRTKPNINNMNRSTSLKPLIRGGISESDIQPKKDRRQSQLMQVLSRSKTMGSNEDLSSLSSSNSNINISNFTPPPLTQVQVYQLLSENLGSLVRVTNDQDLELGRMKVELQEARSQLSKAEHELAQSQNTLHTQQKESERQLRNERENYAKLSREFKRNKEKNQKLAEQQRHLKTNSEEFV